jgi:hypothetical protein
MANLASIVNGRKLAAALIANGGIPGAEQCSQATLVVNPTGAPELVCRYILTVEMLTRLRDAMTTVIDEVTSELPASDR